MISRILGLDVGDVRIGVAVSDPLGYTAQPLDLIIRDKKKTEISEIKRLIDYYGIKIIIVGLPRAADGNVSEQGKKIQKFAEEVKNAISVEVIFREEYLTTQMAEEILIESGMSRSKRKQKVDKIAASLILQGYLDSLNLKNNINYNQE